MARNETVFTFPNTANAVAGEQALLAASVAVRVMPRPSALGEGCGICLRVDEEERERSEAVLRDAGVRVEAVFLKTRENGTTCYQTVL